LSLDDEGRLLQHKPAFGGTVVALIASRTRPEMATVRPGFLPAGEARAGRIAETVCVGSSNDRDRVRVVSRQASAEDATALDNAEIVIGIGKGIGGTENLPLLRKLANVMGAAFCTTRDVTDAGWLPKQHQVGLTGRAIAPKLYLAVGVRGAFEHTVGIRRAGIVASINKSPKAPIFKVSDYCVTGDFATVVPPLIERLAEAKLKAAR
jgi:electron transfer flavoprotein alpha subunit